VWALDGKSIVFSSVAQVAPGLYLIRTDGAGEAHRLTETDNNFFPFPGSFSPDGNWLAYSQWSSVENRSKIWMAQVEGTLDLPRLGKAEAFLQTSSSEWLPTYSSDGHWLAYSAYESGNTEVYVRSFPESGGKTQISTGGGSHPVWSRSERKLFFLTPDWRIMVVDYSTTGDSFAAGKPHVWFQRGLAWLGGCYPYDPAPDGKRFAVVLNPAGAGEQGLKPTDSVTVLLNFFDELRRKVPTGNN